LKAAGNRLIERVGGYLNATGTICAPRTKRLAHCCRCSTEIYSAMPCELTSQELDIHTPTTRGTVRQCAHYYDAVVRYTRAGQAKKKKALIDSLATLLAGMLSERVSGPKRLTAVHRSRLILSIFKTPEFKLISDAQLAGHLPQGTPQCPFPVKTNRYWRKVSKGQVLLLSKASHLLTAGAKPG